MEKIQKCVKGKIVWSDQVGALVWSSFDRKRNDYKICSFHIYFKSNILLLLDSN